MSILFVLQQFKVCVMMAIAHIFFGKRLWMLKARPRWLKYTLTVAISVVTLLGTTYVSPGRSAWVRLGLKDEPTFTDFLHPGTGSRSSHARSRKRLPVACALPVARHPDSPRCRCSGSHSGKAWKPHSLRLDDLSRHARPEPDGRSHPHVSRPRPPGPWTV